MQCENDYYYHLPMKFLDTSKDYDMAKLYFFGGNDEKKSILWKDGFI